ncbi:MAG: AtpZ/AtpI family protein [Pirellulaceae bacterium]|nr:AtpZ/AtpI family protein [Pirellulaceae bacterium]
MNHPDDRSALAVAVARASHVTTIALEMALPALVGHWIDRWLNTGFVFLLLGTVSGIVLGMWHLLQFARQLNANECQDAKGRQRPRDSVRRDEDA